MQLLIATRNAGKLSEIGALLSSRGIRCIGLADFPGAPAIVEDAADFAGNAVKKAVITALFARCWTLADDSGLEVTALDNAPGVFSARYAGAAADDAANNRKLLAALDGITQRTAQFRCVLALASPAGHAQIVEGGCTGRIATEPRGNDGFGYDPLFIPDGYDRTLAELGPDIKNRISHRAAAYRQAVARWSIILEQNPPDWPARDGGRNQAGVPE